MLHLRVPAGIGDISWCFSKLISLNQKLNISISADNPKRSLGFVRLLDNVEASGYASFNFHNVVLNCLPHTTKKDRLLEIALNGFQNFALNTYLEKGNRIEKFMPDIPTEFHYNINTTPDDKLFASSVFKDSISTIGVYTSNYINNSAWNGWLLYHWKTLIYGLRESLPNATFVFLGAEYDTPLTNDLVKLISPTRTINLCGSTSLGQVIEVIKLLDYFISYPSGLAVLSNVVSTPVMMFYPKHLVKLMYSWPCPKSIADNSYKGCVFPKPEEALDWLFSTYKLTQKLNRG